MAPPLRVLVRTHEEDDEDVPQNKHRCPIARSIELGDRDTLFVAVDRKRIKFSRYSTNLRYVYQTPPEARDFIDAFDNDEKTESFWMELNDDDLISERSRKQRDPVTAPKKHAYEQARVARSVDAGAGGGAMPGVVEVSEAQQALNSAKRSVAYRGPR